ncbi:hypothetical protein EVAR_57634_1 [Eumeta japonica]|uniref:Uncharacterized protein n=1 Tax=Eumeta variegata TaxID=151549 RepID=A0A4C1ZSM6_EUMVA|nr:hypothetical protein EVAR_57634_1 [Eumeta japonica]
MKLKNRCASSMSCRRLSPTSSGFNPRRLGALPSLNVRVGELPTRRDFRARPAPPALTRKRHLPTLSLYQRRNGEIAELRRTVNVR